MATARKPKSKAKVEVEVDEDEDLEELEDDLDELEALADEPEDEDEDDEEEEDDDEEEAPRARRKKKTSTKKPSRKSDTYGTSQLADDLETDGKNLRVMLRDIGANAPKSKKNPRGSFNEAGRYEWKDLDDALDTLGFDSVEDAIERLAESRNTRLDALKERNADKKKATAKSKKARDEEEDEDEEFEDEEEEEPAPKKRRRSTRRK